MGLAADHQGALDLLEVPFVPKHVGHPAFDAGGAGDDLDAVEDGVEEQVGDPGCGAHLVTTSRSNPNAAGPTTASDPGGQV